MMEATEERQRAAMHAAIGNQCAFSAPGYEVIFVEGFRRQGRADLSGHRETAEKQLKFAEIDSSQVTYEQLEEYRQWRAEADERHAMATAHFVITAPRGELTREMANHIQLKVSGEVICWLGVRCLEVYDKDAINNIGGKGAYALQPHAEGIRAGLKRIQRAYPKFASAPVTNNTEVNLDEEEI